MVRNPGLFGVLPSCSSVNLERRFPMAAKKIAKKPVKKTAKKMAGCKCK